MSAFSGADSSRELSTDESRRVIDEIAQVNPNVFLILTGGEPLLRKDVFELAGYAAEKRFTVVLGTNGVLLREKQAKLMRQHGIRGASISLDSTDKKKHDEFRHLRGAWDGAVRATQALRSEGLDFSLHMTVTDWNVEELPAMIDLANEVGAKVLNLFFLVRTGRGQSLTDIAPDQYERILKYLAQAQGVGNGSPKGSGAPRRKRGVRRSLEYACGPGRRPPDPRQVCALFPPNHLGAGSPISAPQELRARLLPSGEVLLSDYSGGGRHAVPLHAGGGGKPPPGLVRGALGACRGLHRSPRAEARWALRSLRVL
jgi:MoaA/NifB/PqqE/SkfB family radical SAM enzyme